MIQQVRIALRNCGIIDPENIDDYIQADGYYSLYKALFEYSPDQLIHILIESGLRGRGGGGFPTGLKIKSAAIEKSDEKFVICNADEGDPGAFMDRAVLEGDPHAVLEAITITGRCIGSTKGVIYIRAEYPLAIERLNKAIQEAYDYGFLGQNILGSDFSFDIMLKLGAGAFVCGEETALIKSIEGKRGEPVVKPPYPSQSGLWNSPTLVNNVETYANICPIIQHGVKWFRQFGTDKSPGTKVFALAGKINNVGLVEVPMGTTLKEVIYDIGGGIVDNKEFKAVQTGGPSGGCITKENIDTPITYENLLEINSMMGSGGMIILDENDCMVNIAKYYLEFTLDESCGKCTPCRVGNTRLHEILQKITDGEGQEEHLYHLKTLSNTIKNSSLCGLGQSAPNPVLSTLKYFENEYHEHIFDKKCRSRVCSHLLTFEVIESKCVGCTLCARNCPVNCIDGAAKQPHKIRQDECIKCGSCFDKCNFNAISIN